MEEVKFEGTTCRDNDFCTLEVPSTLQTDDILLSSASRSSELTWGLWFSPWARARAPLSVSQPRPCQPARETVQPPLRLVQSRRFDLPDGCQAAKAGASEIKKTKMSPNRAAVFRLPVTVT